jgi:hypothetical protein
MDVAIDERIVAARHFPAGSLGLFSGSH